MKTMIFAAACSALLAASTLQAAATPKHAPTPARNAPVITEQVRNARASIVAPEYIPYEFTRGNAESAPAGR